MNHIPDGEQDMLLVQCYCGTDAQTKQTCSQLRASKESFLLGGEELVALDDFSVLHNQQLAIAVADEIAGWKEAEGRKIIHNFCHITIPILFVYRRLLLNCPIKILPSILHSEKSFASPLQTGH